MRIIGGKHRGRKLAEFAGENIRPTSDRAREALFNILCAKLPSSVCLDLFCGSGALGLECLSRGAYKVCFNDVSRDSIAVLKKNICALKEEAACLVTNLDYMQYLTSTNEKFDLIFIDPPYRFDYGVKALEKLAERNLLKEGGVAIYERDRAFEGEVEGLVKYDERKYGKAYLTFFKREE